MSTFTDGVPPSVNPGPQDGPDPDARGTEPDDAEGPDTGTSWVLEEIQRRIASGKSGSAGGRHARRDGVPDGALDPSSSARYVPRHSVATPGPGAPRPSTVGGPTQRPPSGLPRREPGAAGAPAPPAWSRPRAPDGTPIGTAPEPGFAPPPDRRAFPAAAAAVTQPAPSTPLAPPPEWRQTPGVPPAGPLGPAPTGEPLFTARTPAIDGRQQQASSVAPAPLAVPAQRAPDLPRESRPAPPPPPPPPAVDDEPDGEVQARRVRVVLAERKGVAKPVRTVVDIQEGTGVGELLRSNLIGSQLAVALRFAVGASLALGLLPLLFSMFPEIGRMDVLGLRLPWLLLGVLVYPFLFGLGLWHTRIAERIEQNFADHVQD